LGDADLGDGPVVVAGRVGDRDVPHLELAAALDEARCPGQGVVEGGFAEVVGVEADGGEALGIVGRQVKVP